MAKYHITLRVNGRTSVVWAASALAAWQAFVTQGCMIRTTKRGDYRVAVVQ